MTVFVSELKKADFSLIYPHQIPQLLFFPILICIKEIRLETHRSRAQCTKGELHKRSLPLKRGERALTEAFRRKGRNKGERE